MTPKFVAWLAHNYARDIITLMQTPVTGSPSNSGGADKTDQANHTAPHSTVASAAPAQTSAGVECRMIRACELSDHFAIPTTWHERGYGRVLRRTDKHIEANIVGTVFQFRLTDRIVIVGGNQ